MKSSLGFLFFGALFFLLFFPRYSIQLISLYTIFLFLSSFVYSRSVSRGLFIRHRDKVLRAYKYSNLEIRYTIRNNSFFSTTYLFVQDEHAGLLCSDGNERRLVLIGPRREKKFVYSLDCSRRGKYQAGPFFLCGSDPFGLFPWQKHFPDTIDLIVYPAIYPIQLLFPQGIPAGNRNIENPLYEDITRYRSLREYIPGDDLRRINWKVSAQKGELYSREYLPTYYHPSIIILNVNMRSYSRHLRAFRIERAIETAASLVSHIIRKGQDIGFYCRSARGPVDIFPHGGTHQGVYILEALAQLKPVSEGSFEFPNIKIPHRSRVLYVGPPPEKLKLLSFIDRLPAGVYVDIYTVNTDQIPEKYHGLHRLRVFRIRDSEKELVDV